MSSRIAVSVSQRLPSMSRYAAEVSSQGDGKMVWEFPTVMRWNVTEGCRTMGTIRYGEKGPKEDLQF